MSQLGTLGPTKQVYCTGGTMTLGEITAGKRWRLLGGALLAGGAGATFTITSSSGVDAVPVIGPVTLAANGQFILNTSDIGYGDGALGMKLHLSVTSGAVYGSLILQLID